MGFAFDGSMIIPRDAEIRSADDAIDSFNRALASLLLGGVPLDHISASELSFGNLNALGYFRITEPHGPSGRLTQALGEGSASPMLAIERLNPATFTRAEIESAHKLGLPVLDALKNVTPEFLLMSFGFFRHAEYRNSLLYGWFVVEQIINLIWEEIFLESIDISIKSARIGNLKSISKNVATKIEFLAQNNLLSNDLYRRLSEARSSRNNLIHKGIKPNMAKSLSCLRGIVDLIKLVCRHRNINFDSQKMGEPLSQKKAPHKPTSIVTSNPDWSTSSYWLPIKPLPGELHFSGDYENITDICLLPVFRKDAFKDSSNP